MKRGELFQENDIEKVSDAETDDIEAEAAQMEREDSAAMAKRLRIEKKMAEEKYKAGLPDYQFGL
jgi:hypothetical protein